jgi:rhamnulokinase
MSQKYFLAFDFGAESGRAVLGILEDHKITLDEVHRFPTGMVKIDNHFYWNIYRFYEEIVKSINLCVNIQHVQPESIAIDTWGVDFGFLAEDKTLLRIPYAYRDPQSAEAMADFSENVMPPRQIYSLTGIAMQPFNSLFHLHALKRNCDRAFKNATNLLFIPDILNYFLSGTMSTEFSFATTSQLFNPVKMDWDETLLKSIGLDKSLMNNIVQPATVIGNLKADIAKSVGAESVKIISVCSHDTGSAIVAVPAHGNDWAYISSGTWSLMGVELKEAIIKDLSFKYNFTNEGGAEKTIRFLKNIMGLWLLQQCRNSWLKTNSSINYEELISLSQLAPHFKSYIDPDFMGFYNPVDMPLAIDEYCLKTRQDVPQNMGEYVRLILESLAFKYRMTLDQLREVTGMQIRRIHIIGGGAQNKFLCQFTANVTGITVLAGPAEGTAAGNLLMQAKALGYLKDLKEIRQVVKNSFNFVEYNPQDIEEWEAAYKKFLIISEKSKLMFELTN